MARIWNSSPDAPILSLPVKFSYLSFGVGTVSHPIGKAAVDLGVKGGPNHPAFATCKWTTPNEPGHYCIQVLLDWVDDINPNNNLGQENTIVGEAHSPAVFRFRLRNDTPRPQTYRFEVDTYQIPPPPFCDQLPSAGLEQHDRRNYPVPPGWTVSFTPAEPRLNPGEEQAVRVIITPPNDFKGRQHLNIHAFHGNRLAGGVTVYVERVEEKG